MSNKAFPGYILLQNQSKEIFVALVTMDYYDYNLWLKMCLIVM